MMRMKKAQMALFCADGVVESGWMQLKKTTTTTSTMSIPTDLGDCEMAHRMKLLHRSKEESVGDRTGRMKRKQRTGLR